MKSLGLDRIKQMLTYDPLTGLFTWIARKQRVRVGKAAGYRRHDGYSSVFIDGHRIYAHRLAWWYVHGSLPAGQIDHIDHDPTNNRIANLRVVSSQDNNKNRSLDGRNKSGVIGVYWAVHANKWTAQIRTNRKTHHLGYFAEIEQAAAARKSAELAHAFHDNHGKT